MQLIAHPSIWALLIAVLALMGGLVLYVSHLNRRLRHSKKGAGDGNRRTAPS